MLASPLLPSACGSLSTSHFRGQWQSGRLQSSGAQLGNHHHYQQQQQQQQQPITTFNTDDDDN